MTETLTPAAQPAAGRALEPVSMTLYDTDFQAFADKLGQSFKRYGFAVISDHGLDETVIDAAVQYAQNIPVNVIGRMLGFPAEDEDLFREFVHTTLERINDEPEARAGRAASAGSDPSRPSTNVTAAPTASVIATTPQSGAQSSSSTWVTTYQPAAAPSANATALTISASNANSIACAARIRPRVAPSSFSMTLS